MLLCETVALVCILIYQKIFCPNNQTDNKIIENNRKNNLERIRENREKREKEREKREMEKRLSKLKSKKDFNSEDEYDNYMIENDLLCIICFSPLIKNTTNLKCGHNYHNKCLNQWKKYSKSCPICKSKIS